MAICAICGKEVSESEAPILYMTGAGVPRLICDEHAALIDTATEGRDPESIKAAIAQLGDDLIKGDTDDLNVIGLVNEIIKTASERAELIEKGELDLSLDDGEDTEDEDFDITPDMMETEEDKAKTEKEEKINKIVDNILTWVMGLAIVVAVAIFTYIVVFK